MLTRFFSLIFSHSKRTPFFLLATCFTTNMKREQIFYRWRTKNKRRCIILRLSINETIGKEKVSDEWFFSSWRASCISPKDGNESHKTPVQVYARNYIYTFLCLFQYQRRFDKKWFESVLDVTRNRVILRWFITSMIFSIVFVRISLAQSNRPFNFQIQK